MKAYRSMSSFCIHEDSCSLTPGLTQILFRSISKSSICKLIDGQNFRSLFYDNGYVGVD